MKTNLCIKVLYQSYDYTFYDFAKQIGWNAIFDFLCCPEIVIYALGIFFVVVKWISAFEEWGHSGERQNVQLLKNQNIKWKAYL